MNKKKSKLIFLAVIFIFTIFFIVYKCSTLYIFVNPHTNTNPIKYINPTIRELDKAFHYAKISAKGDDKDFKYAFFYAYGSGFLENNDIPNDLDYAVGIDLGEYTYNGSNINEIAKSIVDKIFAFKQGFIFYLNTNDKKHIYPISQLFDIVNENNALYDNHIKDIQSGILDVLKEKNYVRYTDETLEQEDGKTVKVAVPYIMEKNEILLENEKAFMLYSDNLKYNPSMKTYLREVTILPEYYFTLIYNGKKYDVEIVPESFLGIKMQLKRIMFASSIFIHKDSINFVKNLEYLNSDEAYLYTRFRTAKDHLNAINNIFVMLEKSIKLFKRLIQVADCLEPILPKDMYADIKTYAKTNLENKTFVLLNEYLNVVQNLFVILRSGNLYYVSLKNHKIDKMYQILVETCNELEKLGTISQSDMSTLKHFTVDMREITHLENQTDIDRFSKTIFEEKWANMKKFINKLVLANILEPKKLDFFITYLNNLYSSSGFHNVNLYWIGKNNIGIEKDEFTENIKDINKFVKENSLIDVNYKLISKQEIPSFTVRYDVLARWKSSDEENANYNKMSDNFLKNKKMYSLKYRFGLTTQN